ncbi:MAG TPA: MOSC N-terminal beta barrel domain-containing protein [Chthoniobacterales bacterium]|nr:MOSC N-terminal beta barrel domain-containing protein [Chthoniobacterales bacterium]
MSFVGKVESLWRYPVKSMRGEELDEMFAGYAGVYGDRLFAFESSASPKGFPFFTGRDQRQIIRYRAHFRNPEKAARPVNWSEAQKLSPNLNPISADPTELMVDVETPDGKTFAIDDPALIDHLRGNTDGNHELRLLRSDKAITDCLPLSIFAVQTAKKLGEESGVAVDKRRFRANVYVDLTSSEGFAEDKFVGRSLRIGSKVTVAVLARDARCMMITLDPDTAEKTPAILKAVAQAHEGTAGVYGAVLAEGMIRKGDSVELMN